MLVAVAGALQWNWFAMPLERDEGEYAYAAWLMRTGKGVPYRDSFLQKPPMIVYTYALAEAVSPKSDKVGFRVAGFLAALATAGLVWGLGKREFGGGAGVLAAWMWVAFLQQFMMFNSVAANVEKFMVVPMLGAMALVGAGERRAWRWGLAGALAAVAVLYKPICGPVLGMYFLWRGWGRSVGEWREAWRWWGAAVLCGAAATAAGVAWFAWKGAVGAMWECAVAYTGEYARLNGNVLERGAGWLLDPENRKAWVILSLAALGFCRRARVGWGWGAVLAVAWGVAMADANGHYYVMALPLAALGAGAGIERLAARCGRGRAWIGATCVAVVFAVLLPGREWSALRCSPTQLSGWIYSGNPFREAEGAGQVVAALCPEEGTVHIVGSEPEVLWYARRRGTTRFDIAYPLTLPTRYAARFQTEALATLEKEPPAVVLVVPAGGGFGFGPFEVYRGYLEKTGELLLGGKYRLACSFMPGGGWVPGGEWQERRWAGATMGVFGRVGGESEK